MRSVIVLLLVPVILGCVLPIASPPPRTTPIPVEQCSPERFGWQEGADFYENYRAEVMDWICHQGIPIPTTPYERAAFFFCGSVEHGGFMFLEDREYDFLRLIGGVPAFPDIVESVVGPKGQVLDLKYPRLKATVRIESYEDKSIVRVGRQAWGIYPFLAWDRRARIYSVYLVRGDWDEFEQRVIYIHPDGMISQLKGVYFHEVGS